MKKYLLACAALLYPGVIFAAENIAPTKALVYRILDAGVFVALIIFIYVLGIVLGIKTMKVLGAGSLHKMLSWLTWGLVFGVAFQTYIFVFDYKKVGGFSAANVSVGWHIFFIITVLLMVVGMQKILKR